MLGQFGFLKEKYGEKTFDRFACVNLGTQITVTQSSTLFIPTVLSLSVFIPIAVLSSTRSYGRESGNDWNMSNMSSSKDEGGIPLL